MHKLRFLMKKRKFAKMLSSKRREVANMLAKIIMALVGILVVATVIHLVRDSEVFGERKSFFQGITVSFDKLKPKTMVVGGPTICIREQGKKFYKKIKMHTQKFIICGPDAKEKFSRADNIIVIDDPTVEKKHVEIIKRCKDEEVYYELINYGKINPVYYYNHEDDDYKPLAHKQGIQLKERDAFYVGNVKMIITIPTNVYKPSQTERIGKYVPMSENSVHDIEIEDVE